MKVKIVTWVALFLFGAALSWVINEAIEPDCPTEDSCSIDYRDGGWHIEEVTP